MIGVCFTLETHEANVYADRTVDLQDWRESLKILGCTDLYVINVAGVPLDFQDDYITIHEVLGPPAMTLVVLDPQGEVNLLTFTHPAEDVCYVVGPDSVGLHLTDFTQAVKIPSVNEYTETWALAAANIALYDRIAKA